MIRNQSNDSILRSVPSKLDELVDHGFQKKDPIIIDSDDELENTTQPKECEQTTGVQRGSSNQNLACPSSLPTIHSSRRTVVPPPLEASSSRSRASIDQVEPWNFPLRTADSARLVSISMQTSTAFELKSPYRQFQTLENVPHSEKKVVDLVSESSDMDIDDDNSCLEHDSMSPTRSPSTRARLSSVISDTEAAIRRITTSPALSYMAPPEPIASPYKRSPIAIGKRRCSDSSGHNERKRPFLDPVGHSSDDDSDSDEEATASEYPEYSPPWIDSSNDIVQRLVNGTIEEVDEIIARASSDEHRNMHLLAQSVASRLSNGVATRGSSSDASSHTGSSSRRRDSATTRNLRAQNSQEARGTQIMRQASQHQPMRAGLVQNTTNVTVNLPKSDYARGRRLLVPENTSRPMAAVYMRGDMQFVHQDGRYRLSTFSLPSEGKDEGVPTRRVVDAQLLGDDTVIVAYDCGPSQISYTRLSYTEPPQRLDLQTRGHNTVFEHRRTGKSSQNPGISALAAMPQHPVRFLSGGGDGTIQLWTMSHPHPYSASIQSLGFAHSGPIRCLAYRSSDNQVFSCFHKRIHAADIKASRASDPIRLTAAAQQIHVHPQDPSIIVLEACAEVDHLDRQIQIFDTRKGSFEDTPCIEFGYRQHRGTTTVERFSKGSTQYTLFARGFGDGTVCLWDYRNAKNVSRRFQGERTDPITHTVLRGGEVIAYGSHSITFWNTRN
ncbi:hypothetical protein PHLCEN_2v10539 [Hermanssonia centrifuga]|uniref:Uncharacterized protein n=1 Tax=Hermanssonia centrifuga TaxID=98765 RepID=A0A2R6NMP1_9APHY|nr:hypothetical protein PHLCEN_2v10539 [Hermanssonia centrifuga]